MHKRFMYTRFSIFLNTWLRKKEERQTWNGNSNAYTRRRQFNQRYHATSRQRPLNNSNSANYADWIIWKLSIESPKANAARAARENRDRKLSRNQPSRITLARQNWNVEIETGNSEFERSEFFHFSLSLSSSPFFHRNEIPLIHNHPPATERDRRMLVKAGAEVKKCNYSREW